MTGPSWTVRLHELKTKWSNGAYFAQSWIRKTPTARLCPIATLQNLQLLAWEPSGTLRTINLSSFQNSLKEKTVGDSCQRQISFTLSSLLKKCKEDMQTRVLPISSWVLKNSSASLWKYLDLHQPQQPPFRLLQQRWKKCPDFASKDHQGSQSCGVCWSLSASCRRHPKPKQVE